jgi:hypothetical protein
MGAMAIFRQANADGFSGKSFRNVLRLADVHLRLALARVPPSCLRPNTATHVTTLAENDADQALPVLADFALG